MVPSRRSSGLIRFRKSMICSHGKSQDAALGTEARGKIVIPASAEDQHCDDRFAGFCYAVAAVSKLAAFLLRYVSQADLRRLVIGSSIFLVMMIANANEKTNTRAKQMTGGTPL